MSTPAHKECIRKLIEIGVSYGFCVLERSIGLKYHLATIDVLWCIDCNGKKGLTKILGGERCKCAECRKRRQSVHVPIITIDSNSDKKKKILGGCSALLQPTSSSAYLPVVAFEVASSEKEKQLRGSVMSLQLAGASAGVIVLVGAADTGERKSFVKKLIARYSSGRLRIWTQKDVDRLYQQFLH